MSFGVNLCIGIALGLGNIATFFLGHVRNQAFGNLITENNDNLVQKGGGFILV